MAAEKFICIDEKNYYEKRIGKSQLIFYSFLVVQKVLKVKKSIMFHIFTSHVAKNGWKNQIRIILSFLVEKWGVSSRGTPHLDPFGVSKGTPAFEPPFSYLKIENRCSFCFPHCFP